MQGSGSAPGINIPSADITPTEIATAAGDPGVESRSEVPAIRVILPDLAP